MLSFDVRADPVGVEQKSPSWCIERITTMSNDTKTTSTFTPKRFRGIDYSFRPASYWDDTSVLHATLRDVKGENRRRLIRDFHAAGHLEIPTRLIEI